MRWPVTINIGEIKLRMPSLNDAAHLFSNLCNDEQVTKYLTWKPHQNVEETTNVISGMIEDNINGKSMTWFVEKNLLPVGMITCWLDDDNGVEIGFCLSPAEQGKGIMNRAVSALLKEVSNIGIYHCWATTDIDNAASQRLLEKLKFNYVKTISDHVVHPNISDEPRASKLYQKEYINK